MLLSLYAIEVGRQDYCSELPSQFVKGIGLLLEEQAHDTTHVLTISSFSHNGSDDTEVENLRFLSFSKTPRIVRTNKSRLILNFLRENAEQSILHQ